MANIGEIAEFVNNDEFTLEVGAPSDNYITLEDLVVKIGNREYSSDTNDSGPMWFIGGADNFMTFVLVLTHPEYKALNTLTQPTAGVATSTDWLVKTVSLDDTGTSMAATGYLRDYVVSKGPKGYLNMSCFVRITSNTVTIT